MIELALAILKLETHYFGEPRESEGVRLALHVLRPYVDRHTLVTFWGVAIRNPNPTQRCHNLRRVLSLIEAGVGRG